MDSTEAGLGKGIRAANSDNRKPPLRRRTFLSGATAATALSWPGSGLSQTAERATRVRLSDSRIMSARRSYSYNIIADPTGSAPTDRIERFELRGGDCPTIGRDCVPRPFGNGRTVQRTRTEKVIETRLRDGDEGLFRYWLYLPSAEFNFVDSVNTALGQLLAA